MLKQSVHKFFLRVAYLSKLQAKRFKVDPSVDDWNHGLYLWHKDPENKKLRYQFPLNKNSVVFDFGGFDGQYASDIYGMYGSKIYVFEPLPQFYTLIKDRFRHNPDIFAFPYGLAANDRTEVMNVAGDATSFLSKKERGNTQSVIINLKKATTFIDTISIKEIDLAKINIEGGEYELLEYLIEKDLIARFKNILIQFHHFVDNAESRMASIHKELSKTHTLKFQFKFAWESWERK